MVDFSAKDPAAQAKALTNKGGRKRRSQAANGAARTGTKTSLSADRKSLPDKGLHWAIQDWNTPQKHREKHHFTRTRCTTRCR